jgi:hypothetical protein
VYNKCCKARFLERRNAIKFERVDMVKIRGWVYVISNPAMIGILKIGFSTKDPELRAKEFDHTNSPHPFVVEYDVLVQSPRDLEQAVHKKLLHVNEGKEWFRCSLSEAITAIREVVGSELLLENYMKMDRDNVIEFDKNNLDNADAQFKIGENYFLSATSKDAKKAMEWLILADVQGHSEARTMMLAIKGNTYSQCKLKEKYGDSIEQNIKDAMR